MPGITAEERERRELGYHLWLGAAHRNVSDTARRLGIPRTTVQSWHDRDQWDSRAAADDAELWACATGDARRSLALAFPRMVARYVAYVTGEPCYTGGDGPALPPLDKDAARDVRHVMACMGIVPQRSMTLRVQAAPALPVSDAELEHYRVTGNVAALIALAAGRSVDAPPEDAPPGDFASGQPGGRGAPGPTPPVPDESANGHGEAVDATFREVTSQPEPERHYDPDGETYTEVPQD